MPQYLNCDETEKELVSAVVEKSLFKMGKSAYERINDELNLYNCNMICCCEHPEYLVAVFKKHFGITGYGIVESIAQELNKAVPSKPITRFLEALCTPFMP